MAGKAIIRRATEADAAIIHALVVELAAAIGMSGKVASHVADIRDRGFGADPAFVLDVGRQSNAKIAPD